MQAESGLWSGPHRMAAGRVTDPPFLDTARAGTELLAEGDGLGGPPGAKFIFVSNDGDGYDVVHPLSAAGASPYRPSLACSCGSPNPDGKCSTGRVSTPFVPPSEAQLRHLQAGWSSGLGVLDDSSLVSAYLRLRAAPPPLTKAQSWE